MLVLKRRARESILIGNDVRVTIVRVDGGGVRVGVEAPEHIAVDREEVRRRINRRTHSESVCV